MVITLHGLEKTEFFFNFQPGGFGMVGLTAPLQFRWIFYFFINLKAFLDTLVL